MSSLSALPTSARPASRPSTFRRVEQRVEKTYDGMSPWLRAGLILLLVLTGMWIVGGVARWWTWRRRHCHGGSGKHHHSHQEQSGSNKSANAQQYVRSPRSYSTALLSNPHCGYCQKASEFLERHAPEGVLVVVVEQGQDQQAEKKILDQYDIQDDGARPILVNLRTGFRQTGFNPHMSEDEKRQLAQQCFSQ